MKLFGSLKELVAVVFRKNSQEITLRPNQSTTYTAARDIQLPPGDTAHVLTSASASQTLTGKTIDGDDNTLQDISISSLKTVLGDADEAIVRDGSGAVVSAKIVNANIDAAAAIDASKIADGSVSNAEFQYLGNVTSDIQTQFGTKVTGPASATDDALVRYDSTTGKLVQNSVGILSDAGALSGLTQLDVDNVRVDGNTISSTNTNGDIVIDPNGTGSVSVVGPLKSDTSLILEETGAGTDTITIQAPSSIAASYTLTLPVDDGVSGEVLSTNGSGVLSWVEAGGNTTPQVLLSSRFNSSISAVSTYADAAAATPVDGTGGSPNVTVTQNSSSPINGLSDLKFSKDAANRQGQGFSIPFSIAATDKEKKARIWLRYNSSNANYVAGDVAFFVYDVTNGILKTPSTSALPKATSIFEVGFDLTSGVDYRLICHVATTNASAYDLYFDDIIVDLTTVGRGPIVGAWTSFTPTGTWTTNTTYTGQYRRVGENVEFDIRVSTSGAPNAANLEINMPFGWQIDTTKMLGTPSSSGGAALRGSGAIFPAGIFPAHVVAKSSTVVQVRGIDSSGTYGNDVVVTDAIPQAFGAGDFVHIQFEAPIVGFANEGVTLSQADTTRKTKRVDLTLSSFSGISTPGSYVADAVSHMDSTGKYFSFVRVAFATGTTNAAFTFIIDNLITGENQCLTAVRVGGGAATYTSAFFDNTPAGRVDVGATVNNNNRFYAHGWIHHGTSKPAWFDANVENAIDASIFVQNATLTTPGLAALANSSVLATSSAGVGSSSTRVREYTAATVVGTDITHTTSSTAGSLFTINTAGVYAMTAVDNATTAHRFGVALNASGSTGISSLANANRLVTAVTDGSSLEATCSVVWRLAAGDVITHHTDGVPDVDGGNVQFRIQKICN